VYELGYIGDSSTSGVPLAFYRENSGYGKQYSIYEVKLKWQTKPTEEERVEE
jgi:hypothetical protein